MATQPSFQFGSSGSASGSGANAGFQFKVPKNDLNITARQALELSVLAEKAKGRSVLGDIIHGTGHGVGWALDKLLRPTEAVASGALEGFKGQGFHLGPALHGAREGFMGREHATFSDLIRQEFPDWAKHHKVLTAVGGLAADIVTDPTLPLVLAAQVVPGLNVAVDVAEGARIASLIGRGTTAAERYKNSREAYKALKELGPGFDARKTLAAREAISARTELRGGLSTLKDQEALAMAQESAKQEFESQSQRIIQARYSIPFSRGRGIPLTPTTIAGRRVAPLAPSLLRTAEGGGILGKVPGLAAGANTLGVLFKHGFREEEYAKPHLIRQHSEERLADMYIAHAASVLRPLRHLTEQDREKALSFGEETPGIVAGAGRVLDENILTRAVENGRLTKDQADFVRAWHTHMQYLKARDSEFGVKYEKELGAKVYVPHIYDRTGTPVTQSSIRRATGFSKERKVDVSLRELKGFSSDKVKSLNLETDIMNILTHRTRRAAREHASVTLLEHMRISGGVVARVPDDAKRAKILGRIGELKAKQDKVPLLGNQRGRRISMGRQVQVRAKKKLMAAVQRHDKKLQEYKDRVDEHLEAHLKKQELPNEIARINKQHDDLIATIKAKTKEPKLPAAVAKRMQRGEKITNADRANLLTDVSTLSQQGKEAEAKVLAKWLQDTAKGGDITKGEYKNIAKPRAAEIKKAIDTVEKSRAATLAKAHREHGAITPSWSRMAKMGAERLNESIRHFTEKDQVRAKKLHGEYTELKRLRAQHTKLSQAKGGPQTKAKALAAEVEALTKRHGSIGRPLAPRARGETWRGNIATALKGLEDSVKKEWQELAAGYPTKVVNVDHAKAIGRIADAEQRTVDRLAADIEKIKEDARLHANKLEEEFGVEFALREKQFNRHQANIDRLTRVMDKKFMRNPAIPPDYVMYPKELAGDHYFFKPEVHAGMTRIEKTLGDDRMMAGVGAMSRKLLATWKLGVTSVNPGYRIRNTLSDLWNMYIAGVPTPQILRYGRKAAALQVRAGRAGQKLISEGPQALTRNEIKALERMAEMYNHGVLSGLFQGDVQVVSEMMRSGRKTTDYINKNPLSVGKFAIRAAQGFNRHAENWGRVTHYLYRRDYQRGSASFAANWVKKAHFDYEELTPFERDKLKMIFPFYTWTRKNIPYQLTQMVSRPGKYATFPKVVRASNELATGAPYTEGQQENLMPSWMRDQYAFRVPGFGDAGYMVPQIGLADLSKVEHPKQLLNLINPALKIPYELGTGKSTLTGQSIAKGPHPLNPVSGLGAAVIGSIPGFETGTTSRVVRGEKLYGEGASPWATYIAGQLPLSNYFINQRSNIKEAQRGGSVLTHLNYLGGMSVINRDYETELVAAQLNFQDQMKRVVRGLRDRGIYPEAPSSGTAPAGFNVMIAQMLAGGR